ncbi:MAG: NifU family protein [Chromatiales bacterium]|nr:NifU family protein [Chromatiales bacterium]
MSESPAASQPVAIRAEPALSDPDSCRFTVSREVHPGGPWHYASAAEAAGSPLPERLFALEGVRRVLVSGTVVTVGKGAGVEWSSLKRAIGSAIRAQLATGIPAVLESRASETGKAADDDAIRARVQQLLDGEVNRSIAAHGGRIVLVRVQQGVLYIRMEGGCQGCASSQFTLRQGFEVMVRRAVPVVAGIVDTTDHQAGRNPFYRAASGS